jgi:hypothetical protein
VQVAEPDVLAPDAQLHQHLEAGDPRRAAAGGDDLDVLEPLARDMQRVGRRRAHDDGGAVLVVVEDGDLHPLAAEPLDDEAVGRLDVLEVDRAEGRLQRADDLGQLLGVGFVQLDVEAVDVGELLEEDALPSITGFEASAPMLPRPSTAVPFDTTATRFARLV